MGIVCPRAASSRQTAPIVAPATVLILGSDQRSASTKEPGGSTTGPSRSDSMQLMRVGGGHSAKLSIPRDTIVEIPGYGLNKINAAYAYGGEALATRTLESLVGVRMDHAAKIDFEGFTGLTTELGGVHLPAGTVVMLCVGAANRDPRKFEDPHEFRPERKNVREHIAFGRGIHTCAGAPLARVEGQITVRRLLDRMSEIRVDEKFHGPSGARNYAYEPTFLLRGLTELHIEFDSAS